MLLELSGVGDKNLVGSFSLDHGLFAQHLLAVEKLAATEALRPYLRPINPSRNICRMPASQLITPMVQLSRSMEVYHQGSYRISYRIRHANPADCGRQHFSFDTTCQHNDDHPRSCRNRGTHHQKGRVRALFVLRTVNAVLSGRPIVNFSIFKVTYHLKANTQLIIYFTDHTISYMSTSWWLPQTLLNAAVQ
jgi:hypothetical protein